MRFENNISSEPIFIMRQIQRIQRAQCATVVCNLYDMPYGRAVGFPSERYMSPSRIRRYFWAREGAVLLVKTQQRLNMIETLVAGGGKRIASSYAV